MPFVVSHPGALQPLRVGHLQRAVVYINEHEDAREVRVAYVPPPNAAPRAGAVTLHSPVGAWAIVPAAHNQGRDDGFASALYDVRPPPGARGHDCGFRVSGFGNDEFVVRFTPDAGQVEETTIVVRKRIAVVYVEMRRPACGAPGRYSLRDYQPPGTPGSAGPSRFVLARVIEFFRSHFGIELLVTNPVHPVEVSNVEPIRMRGGEGIRVAHPVTTQTLAAGDGGGPPLVPEPRRTLWLTACGGVERNRLGGETSNRVALVSLAAAEAQLRKFDAVAAELAKNRRVFGADYTEARWVAERAQLPTGPHFDPRRRAQLSHELYQGTAPADLARRILYNATIHELGHALGLVPANQQCGGRPRASWLDTVDDPATAPGSANAPMHCSDRNCLMWWRQTWPFYPYGSPASAAAPAPTPVGGASATAPAGGGSVPAAGGLPSAPPPTESRVNQSTDAMFTRTCSDFLRATRLLFIDHVH